MKTKILSLLLAAMLMLGLASACSAPTVIDTDREGNSINLPDKIEKVISSGASNTEILVALGCAGKIIAVDKYSSDVEGLLEGLPLFNQMTPDCEQLINLEPDVIFVSGMSKTGGSDPFGAVKEVGICVIYIPSSDSIEGIYEDIRFIASVMGEKKAGDIIVSDMQREIKAIKAIGDKIKDKKTVYFDIGWSWSLGGETFQNEMIEIIGAVNIFADQKGWFAVSDEAILDANPNVILINDGSSSDPIGDITGRPGWDALTAVKNGNVYYIDMNSSNRPCQNIIKALKQMAKAVYPDKYNF